MNETTLAFDELKNLGEDSIYSMAKIEWWLLKYQYLYNRIIKGWKCEIYLSNGSCICFAEEDVDCQFVKQFKTFEEISVYHRKEPFFKNLLSTYKSLKHDQIALKKIIQEHEELCIEDFGGFYFDYLSDDGETEPISGNSIYFKDFDIKISYADFKNTITFLYVYNYWFYEKEILPESIAKIDEKFEANRDPNPLVFWD